MFVIGLTGGIGSGKTAATDYLAQRGATIVDADLASRVVVEPGQPALAEIASTFGAHMLNADGTLNRRALREVVFADKAALKQLEAITHPAINTELRRQIADSSGVYTVLVSPLLLETQQKTLVARVLVIDVPPELQISRTAQRDDVDATQVKAIMAAQLSREERLAQADDVVTNDGDLATLHQQLDALHSRYVVLAKESQL